MSPRLDNADRRAFIGGSDARIIMGGDEAALVRLWREKRGEVEPEDLTDSAGRRSALLPSCGVQMSPISGRPASPRISTPLKCGGGWWSD